MQVKPHPVYQEVSGYICAADKCYPLDQIVNDKLNDRYVLLDPTALTNTFSQPLEHDIPNFEYAVLHVGDRVFYQFEARRHQQMKAIADWWINRVVRDPKFDNGGDPMASALALMMHMSACTPESGAKFAQALREWLGRNWVSYQKLPRMSVDYDPCYEFAQVWAAADLPTKCSPWKTNMWVDGYEVYVACGYGAPTERIF